MANISALESLKQAMAPAPAFSPDAAPLRFGLASLDARLGEMPAAALHEMHAGEVEDAAAASAFTLLLALRAVTGPVLWVREGLGGRPYAPGLAQLGIRPDRLLHIQAPDALSALRAGADITRAAAGQALVLELWGNPKSLDLTATRRLMLTARAHDVPAFLLRIGAEETPSAAHSRWRISAAPSISPGADAPGSPAFDIQLLRHRGGIAGLSLRLEWDRDRLAFREAPLSGGIPSAAPGGTDRAHHPG